MNEGSSGHLWWASVDMYTYGSYWLFISAQLEFRRSRRRTPRGLPPSCQEPGNWRGLGGVPQSTMARSYKSDFVRSNLKFITADHSAYS